MAKSKFSIWRIKKVMNKADDKARNYGDTTEEIFIDLAFEDLMKIQKYLTKQGIGIK